MLFGLSLGLIVAIGVYLRAPASRPPTAGALYGHGHGGARNRAACANGRTQRPRGSAAGHARRESLRVLRDPAAVRGRRSRGECARRSDRSSAAGRAAGQLSSTGRFVQRRSRRRSAEGQPRADRLRVARSTRQDRRRGVQSRSYRPDRRHRRGETHPTPASRSRHRHAIDAGSEVAFSRPSATGESRHPASAACDKGACAPCRRAWRVARPCRRTATVAAADKRVRNARALRAAASRAGPA